MKTSPVHSTNAYEKANANPLMAKDEKSGSPSLFHALTRMEKHAPVRMAREYVSVLVNARVIF
jgi:hypothetical protein